MLWRLEKKSKILPWWCSIWGKQYSVYSFYSSKIKQTKNSEFPNHYSLHCPNSKNGKAKIQPNRAQKEIPWERHHRASRTNQARDRTGQRHNQSSDCRMERDERSPHWRAWEKSSWGFRESKDQGSDDTEKQILRDEKGADRGNDASNYNRDEEDQSLRMKRDCSERTAENGQGWTAWALQYHSDHEQDREWGIASFWSWSGFACFFTLSWWWGWRSRLIENCSYRECRTKSSGERSLSRDSMSIATTTSGNTSAFRLLLVWGRSILHLSKARMYSSSDSDDQRRQRLLRCISTTASHTRGVGTLCDILRQ